MKISSAVGYLARTEKPKTDAEKESLKQVFHACGLIRDIRVHCQDTQRSLAEIKTAADQPDQTLRAKQLSEAITAQQVPFARNKKNIEDLFTSITTLFNTRRDLYNDHGDEISQISDLWARVVQNWPTDPAKTDSIAANLTQIQTWLREILWHCGFITIPPRINEHLLGLRPGQALDFHSNFIDELPDKKDRDHILKFLNDHPLYIQGITDAEQGIIYKASRDPRIRINSLLRILAVILFGILLVTAISFTGDLLHLTGWPVRSDQFHPLLIAYAFVLIGSFVHVLIAAFKQARSGTNQPFTALEDLILWIHIKEFPIMGGILSVWIGLFGMTFLGKLPEWQTAFFVGYGIDSIVDVVLKRFETDAPERIKNLIP